MRRQLKNTIKDGLRTKPSTYEIVKDTLKGAFAGGVLGYLTGLTGENMFNDTKTAFTQNSSNMPNNKDIKKNIIKKQLEENKKNIDRATEEYYTLSDTMLDKERKRLENFEAMQQFYSGGDNDKAVESSTKILNNYIKHNEQLSKEIESINKEIDEKIEQIKMLEHKPEIISHMFDEEEKYPQNKHNLIGKANVFTGITGAFCGGYNGYQNAYKNQPVAHNIVRTNQQVYLLPLDNLPINVNDKINDLQNNHRSYMFIDIFENTCDIHIIGNNSYAQKLREQLGLPKHNDAYLANGDLHFDDLCDALLDIIPQVPNNVSITNLRTDLNNIKNAQPNNNIPQNNIYNQRDWGCRIF